jgi:hypothetical protein
MTIACQLVAGRMAQHMRVHLERKRAFRPARLTSQLKLSVVNGPPRSLMNMNGDLEASRWSLPSPPAVGKIADS